MKALGLDETVVQSGKRSSFFRGADKTIYVNLETVRGNTLFHEIIHPMVDFIKKSDPELYKRIEAEVSEGNVKRRVMKDGRRMKGSYLDWAKANYEGLSKEGQIEEAFAEMMGDAAYGHFKNKASRLNRLREVIKAILTKIGVTSFPENVEAIDLTTMSLSDLRTDLASALVDGRKITVGGVEFEVGESESDIREQAVELLTQEEDLTEFGLDSEKRNTLRDLGTALDARQRKKYKVIDKDTRNDKASDYISDFIKDEVIYSIDNVEDSGAGWYEEKYDRALDNMAQYNDFMKKGEPSRDLFTMLLAITSDGQEVSKNLEYSERLTKEYVETGSIDVDKINFGGTAKKSIRVNVKNISDLLNQFDGDILKVKEFLTVEKSVSEFKKDFPDIVAKSNYEMTGAPADKIKLPMAAMIFGPKLGAFYGNLTGGSGYLTMDRWFNRTFNRYRGIVKIPLDKTRYDKAREAILKLKGLEKKYNLDYGIKLSSNKNLSKDKVVSTSQKIASLYVKDNKRRKSLPKEIKSAESLLNSFSKDYAGLQDAPFGKRDRTFMYESVWKSQDKLSKEGYDVTVADIQAILWYFEKSLYKKFNVQGPPIISYEEVTERSIPDIRMQAPEVEEVEWQESKIGRGDLAITDRREEVREAAQSYFDGKINQEEYLEIVQENSPIKPITQFIDPASLEDIETAVGSKVEGRLDVPIEEGTPVGLRLDIPAYTNKNIWAITVHEDGRGKAMSYTNVARINNVEFISNPGVSLGIARGKLSKSTIARMLGKWSPIEGSNAKDRGENAKQIVVDVMNDPSWSQIGMNPFRHSYFYDRLDGMPVVSADQVVQIGGLVYAKNAEKTTPFDERFEDKRTGLRFQVPTYEMEYTPNSLVSLSMLSDNNRQPEQWVKEIGKGIKGASKDVDTMGLLDLLKAYKKDAKVKSVPKEVVSQLIATNMAQIETKILANKYLGKEDTYRYPEVTLPGGTNYREFLIRDKSPEDIFKAPHYDELGQNLIASARVDDRVGPNGEKILFVQEIQSDWAQRATDKKKSGEKIGFKKDNPPLTKEEVNEMGDLSATYNRAINEWVKGIKDPWVEDLLFESGGYRVFELLKKVNERISNSKPTEDLKNYQRYLQLQIKESRFEDAIVDLPWGQTDLWVGLTIRKLINQASKEGYDQIAFVNGEQSDIVQSHTGENKGTTHKFYNKIVPKNINNELKRLVKGMKYGVSEAVDSYTKVGKEGGHDKFKFIYNKNATINLTPELKAATDKVGPLRFQAPQEESLSDFQKRFALDLNLLTEDLKELDDNFIIDYNATNFGLNPRNRRVVLFDIEQVNLSASKAFSEIKDSYPELNKEKPLIDDPYSSENYSLISKGVGSQGDVFLDNRDNSILKLTKSPYEVIGSLKVMSAQKSKAKFKINFPEIYSIQKINSENNFYAIKRENVEPFNEEKLSEVKDVFSVIKNYYPNYGEGIEFGELLAKEDVYLPIMESIRFQAPQEEGETNVYTSGLASVAFNISEALVNADYAAGGYASQALSSLGLDKGKAYDTRLTSLLAKPFGTHSNKEIKEIMVRSKGNLNVELLRVSENAKKLKEAMKGSDLTSEKVDELLHNMDDIRSMEDSELKFALIDMRMHIDRLSRTLIREGLIEGQTMFTVDANMEVYVRRSYKQFEVKGWEQTDNDIIKKAKDFLYQEAKKDNPDASEERLEEIRDVAFRKLTEEKGILRSLSKSGSLDNLSRVTSIFKEKKAVPQEIRDLWGEIDNPLYNYSNTVSKIARTISAERMYKELNDIGQGTFISDVQTPDNFNELTGARWGTLEGKFVDEEMFTVMNQVSENLDSGQVQKLYNLYMSTVLLNKKMKTVWNPGTHVKNLIGNTAFAMMNGHIGFRGGMYQDAKTSMQVFKNMKSKDFVELYEKLVSLGVVSSSASLQEIRGISEDIGNSNFDLSEYLDENSGNIKKLIAKAKRGVGKPIKNLDEKFMKAYQAEDDVWKIFGYLNEKSRYIKAGIDTKTAEELAAKNIINLYPNYNEIPRIIRLIGRSPLIGSFVAFQAESLRNSKNAVVLGFDEISSNNPKIKKIGAARIAGTIATMTLLEGLQLYTAQFLGSMLGFGGDTDDEEVEERKMRLLLPEWDASGNISYMEQGMLESKQFDGQTERDHYFDYINFSSVSGVGYIKDMIRLSFNDIDTKLGEESAMRVLERMYQPFLGDEMTRIVMQDAVSNKGGKIYNSTDSGPTKAMKIAAYVGQKLQPGITRGITRTGEAIFDADSELVPGYEALAFFGLRISRVNVNKGLGIKGNFLYKDMVDRMGKENLKDRFSVIQSAKDNSDFDEELNKMADLMAGARLNGVSGEDIQGILYNSRVSKPVIEEAYIRYFNRYREDIVNVQDN